MTVPPQALRWKKSNRSSGSQTCVEIAHTRGAVRDSKNPAGPTLTVDLSGMLAVVKSGSLDRHAD